MDANTQPTKKTRLEWLDALRGFTMILVVAFHVSQSGFTENIHHSSSPPFLVLFRMPLFFFVSGFLAYKSSLVWDFPTLRTLLAKKVRVQTVPTVIFFLFAMAVLGSSFYPTMMKNLQSVTKGGYWFTIVLLYMFIVYYLFCFLESRLRARFPPVAVVAAHSPPVRHIAVLLRHVLPAQVLLLGIRPSAASPATSSVSARSSRSGSSAGHKD